MPYRQGEAWNDEDLATLRRMAAASEPLDAIARALERSQEATRSRANRMKIAVRPSARGAT